MSNGKKNRKFDTENETPENVRSLGQRKRFTPNDLESYRAKTDRQKDFLELFFQDIPLISLHGWAGTGKTFIAMAAALQEVFDPSTPYDKLTIVRSAVEVRSIGFLPGTDEEKLEPYEAPYKELLKQLMRFNDPYEMAKSLGYLQFVPTSFLRGMTFDNQIVLVDECENMDISELETVFTRFGINCKMIMIGDDAQSDLERQRQKSGFKEFRKILDNMNPNNVGMVDFQVDDIVRSEIIKDYLVAKSKTK